jgi:hypothetical protein
MFISLCRTLNVLTLLLSLSLGIVPPPKVAAWQFDSEQQTAQPTASVTPERGSCGDRFVARGEGFPVGERVTLVLRLAGAIPHNLPTLDARVAADGTFAVAIPRAIIACLPDQPQPGERQYEVFAVLGFGATEPGTTVASTLFTVSPPPRRCFPQTGQCVDGIFLEYWQGHGELAINGYPITEPFAERLEDGNTYTVQYFERARLEYHWRNDPPYDVLLGQFGRRVLLARTGQEVAPPVEPREGAAYFPETGHTLGGRFREYWEGNGGLAQFGFPLTEPFEEVLEDGGVYAVQYLERARFEYPPEHAPPFDVLLGQFGRQILAEAEVVR